ncbi:LuxR C-terminal-related transcriptional regulator [Curtobacterium sp. RIT-PI-V]|uniref:LuxR C-terminal-related transcriptional regulator n=1 Tax=Curtobacterium sp. RIT-PI-V TaxID=3035296 RepID=UPI0035A8BD54
MRTRTPWCSTRDAVRSAEQLDLAEKTVKNHVSGLLAMFGMEGRTQAAVSRTTDRPTGPGRSVAEGSAPTASGSSAPATPRPRS